MHKPSPAPYVLLYTLLCASGVSAQTPLPEVGDALTLTSEDERFSIRPLFQLQPLFFVAQDLEDTRATRGGMFIRRARLGAAGHLFTEDLRFELEGNWDRGQPGLQDAFFNYAAAPLAHVRVGLQKRPFSRSFIASSRRMLTLERELPERHFFTGRDLGVIVHNDLFRSPEGLEYAVGVFNGTGEDVRLNSTLPDFSLTHAPTLFHPAFVGRLGVNLGGIDGYSEGDLEGGPFRLAVATSALLDAPSATNAGLATAEIDFALKAYGAFAAGAILLESPPLDGSAGEGQVGGYLKGSYTVDEGLVPVVSYAMRAPLGSSSARHEVTAGAAVLLYGWHVRLMTDATLGIDVAPGVTRQDVGVRFGGELSL